MSSPLKQDPAAGDLVGGVAEQGVGERRLPRAVRAHEGVDLAGPGRPARGRRGSRWPSTATWRSSISRRAGESVTASMIIALSPVVETQDLRNSFPGGVWFEYEAGDQWPACRRFVQSRRPSCGRSGGVMRGRHPCCARPASAVGVPACPRGTPSLARSAGRSPQACPKWSAACRTGSPRDRAR